MTILVLTLPELMARRVALAADKLKSASHEDVGLQALELFLDEVVGPVRGRRARSEDRRRQTAARKRSR